MDRSQAAASVNWSSPSTSKDCGANSPREGGYEKRFVLYPDCPNVTLSELNKQQRLFAVKLTLHNEMTEADIRQLLMTEFKDLREASFEFLTRGEGGLYNCPCKGKCHRKHEEGHTSVEWNARNIRKVTGGNRVVYIRKTSVEEAGSSASSNFTQATKRLCTGEPKRPSEDRTHPVSSSDEHSGVEVTHLFSGLDILDPEGEATSGIIMNETEHEQERTNTEEMMEPVVPKVVDITPEKGDIANCSSNTPDSAYSSSSENQGTSTMNVKPYEQDKRYVEEMMGNIVDITPEEGDIAGGYKFVLNVKGSLSDLGVDKTDVTTAMFGESNLVPVEIIPGGLGSVRGKVPPRSEPGKVWVFLYFGRKLIGISSFKYTAKETAKNEKLQIPLANVLEQHITDVKKAGEALAVLGAMLGRGNWKSMGGTSAGDKDQCGNARTEALSLLRMIVETAAKINAMNFFTTIFSTPVARSVFKCFKDEQVRLEEVARENGNEELACFLEEKHKMYQPDENDSDDEVDWKALSKLAAEYQRRNAGSIKTGVVADATSSESSQGYDGDLETSSSDSSDLQSNIGDHLEEAVEESDTTSNSSSEEIKLDSDEQTVEPESRQQEEEPKLDDLIGAPRKQLSLPVSEEEEVYEESDEPDPPPPYSSPASHAEEAYHLCAQEISQQAGSILDLSQGNQDQAVTTFGPAPRKQLSLAVSEEEKAYEESDEPDPPPPYSTPACSPPQVVYHFGAQESPQSTASVTDSGQGHREETVTTFDLAPRKQLSLAVSEEEKAYEESDEPDPPPPYSTAACSPPQVAYYFGAQESPQSTASVTDSGQGHQEETVTTFDSAPRKQLSLAVSEEEKAYEESERPDPPPLYFTPACSPPQVAYHFGAQESSQSMASVTDSGQGHQEETVTTFSPAPRKQLSLAVSVEEEEYEYSGEPDPSPYSAPACCPPQVAYHVCAQESQQSMASVTDLGQGHLEQIVTVVGPEIMKPAVLKVTDITPKKWDITQLNLEQEGTSNSMMTGTLQQTTAGFDTGIVMASLYANLGGNLLLVGAIPYEYTDKGKENNENDPAYVERLLEKLLIDEKEAEWLMFIATRIGRGDWKPKKGTSANDKKQCENDRTEALSLLRKIVETAAKINAMKFFTIIFSTPVAHSVFKCFKGEQVRLEEVARANGNEELACFLEEKHKMYQPDESDSDDEVDWRALSKVAAEYRRRNAGSIETGVVPDATSSESSQSYYGDPETSSLDSSDLQSNVGDHLGEAVGEPDTTSNSNSEDEEIKLNSDEQTVEPESRQQEEEPNLDDLIKGGAPPTTHNFDPGLCELEIIQTTFAPFGVEKHRPLAGLNASSCGLAGRNTVTPAPICSVGSVSYVVAMIRNIKTEELWQCTIAADKSSTCLLINGGMYKIKARTFPHGSVTSSNVDHDSKPLRQHEGMLNVLMKMELACRCEMFLTDNQGNVLSYVMTEVQATAVADHQHGPLLTVEFPLARIQLSGLYEQFTRDQLSLERFVDTHYKCQDLIPRIILEESVMALVQGNWEECEEKASKAVAMSGRIHSPDINIIRAVMKYRVGTVRRLNGDLKGAWECMDEANENNRQLSVKARLLPSDQGTVMASKKELKREEIPSNQVTFQVLLRSNEKQMCNLFIELCSSDVTLDLMRYDIRLGGEDLGYVLQGDKFPQPLRKQRPQGYYASHQGQEILAQFQIMADNGERTKFLQKRYGMQEWAKSGSRHYQLLLPFVLYEEALMYLHENELEDAAAVAQQAIGCDQHSANHCYLVAKPKIIFSAIQHRAGNFEESQELLRQAIELLDGCASGFEKAESMYAMATLLSEKSAAVGISTAEKRYVYLCFSGHLDDERAVENTISSRLRARSSNRRLYFLLKTSRHARNPANRRAVSEKTMEEARKDIRRVECGTLKNYTKKQKMSFFIVKADFYIIQEDFRNAVEPLSRLVPSLPRITGPSMWTTRPAAWIGVRRGALGPGHRKHWFNETIHRILASLLAQDDAQDYMLRLVPSRLDESHHNK